MSVAASPDGEDPGQAYGGVRPLAGVGQLAREYDGFIIDQWGVLHDGSRPYAGAVECLQRLRAAGRRIVILSNTGRREAANLRLMQDMGFDPALFDRFVTAGEDAREAIAQRRPPFHSRLGSRYYAFTREADALLLEGLDVRRVESVDQADFLVVISIDSPKVGLADLEPQLRAGAAARLPMVCANPDITRPAAQGLLDAAGVIAQRYEALGGDVFYHGKPYPAIYASCLAALGDCAPERVIAVGDSLEHDVLGASRAGLRSALVVAGIHAPELGARDGALPTEAAWRRFASTAVALPNCLVPAFVW